MENASSPISKEEDQIRRRKHKSLEKLKKKVSSILPSVFRTRKSPQVRCSSTGNCGSEGEICNFDRGMLMIVKRESCGSNRLGKFLVSGHQKGKIGWSVRRNEANYKRINGGDAEEGEGEEEPCKIAICI